MEPDYSFRRRLTSAGEILQQAYLLELKVNSTICLGAWQEVQAAAGSMPEFGTSREHAAKHEKWLHNIWGHAYSMVESARRLIRIIWDSGGSKSLRRNYPFLVSAVQLSKRAPVVSVRDALEHVEDRIELYVRESTLAGIEMVSGWGATDDPQDRRDPNYAYFRRLNISTFKLWVRDEREERSCSLRAIASDVEKIGSMLPDTVGGMFVKQTPAESWRR